MIEFVNQMRLLSTLDFHRLLNQVPADEKLLKMNLRKSDQAEMFLESTKLVLNKCLNMVHTS